MVYTSTAINLFQDDKGQSKNHLRWLLLCCAGRENRTLTSSLARTCPTTKRYPHNENYTLVLSIFKYSWGLGPYRTSSPTDSVTDDFLLKISSTPPRAVALRLSNPSTTKSTILCSRRDSNPQQRFRRPV